MSPLRTRARGPIVAPDVQVIEEERHWVLPKEEPKKDIEGVAKDSSSLLSSDIGFADSLVSMMPSSAMDGKLLAKKLQGMSLELSQIDKSSAKRMEREVQEIGKLMHSADSMKESKPQEAAEIAREAEAKLKDLLENRIPMTRALDALGTDEALTLKERYASTFADAGTKRDWRDAMMFESIALYLDGKAASALVETAGARFEQNALDITKELSGGQANHEVMKRGITALRDGVAGLKADLVLRGAESVYSFRHRYAEIVGISVQGTGEAEIKILDAAKAAEGKAKLDPDLANSPLLGGIAALRRAYQDAEGVKKTCQLYLLKRYADSLDSLKIYKEMGDADEMVETHEKELGFIRKLSEEIAGPTVSGFKALQSVLKFDDKEVPDNGFVRSMFGALHLIERGEVDKAALVVKCTDTYLERVKSGKMELDIDSKLAFLSGISAVLGPLENPKVKMNAKSAALYLDSLGKRFEHPLVPLDERASGITSSLSDKFSKPFIWSLSFRKDNLEPNDLRAVFEGAPLLVQRALGKAIERDDKRVLEAANLYAQKREIFDSDEMAEQKALLFSLMVKALGTLDSYKAAGEIRSLKELADQTELKLSALLGEAREIPGVLEKSAPPGFEKSYKELAQMLSYSLHYPDSLRDEDRGPTRYMIQAAIWFAGERSLWDPAAARSSLDALVPAAARGEPLARAKLAMWHYSMFQHDAHIEAGRRMHDAFNVANFSHFGFFDCMKAYSGGLEGKLMNALVPINAPTLDDYLGAAGRTRNAIELVRKNPGLEHFLKPIADGLVALIATTPGKDLEKAVDIYVKGIDKIVKEGKLVADDNKYADFRTLFEAAALAQSSRVKGSSALLKLVRELGPWTPASISDLGIVASILKKAAALDKPDLVFTPLAQKLMADCKLLSKDPSLKFQYMKALGKAFRAESIGEREMEGIRKLDKSLPLLAYCMEGGGKEALLALEGHEKAGVAMLDIAQMLTNMENARQNPDKRDNAWASLVQSSLLFPLIGKGLDMRNLPKGMEWVAKVNGVETLIPIFSKARESEDARKSAEYLLTTKIRMLNWLYGERDDSLGEVFAKAGPSVKEFEEATGGWAVKKYEGNGALGKSDHDAIFSLAKKDIKLVIDAGIYRSRLLKLKDDDSENFETDGQKFTKAVALLDRSLARFATNEFQAHKFTEAFKNELGAGYARGNQLFAKWKEDNTVNHNYQTRNLRIIESGDLPDTLRMGVIGSTKSCQAFDDDRVMASGLIGSIELPWIKKIAVYDESGQPLYRRVLMLVKETGSNKPVLLVQPVYKDDHLPSGLAKSLKEAVGKAIAARYGGADGIEIRDIGGPMNDDRDNPRNYGYSTYGSGESPFCYIDSNANSGNPYGLHARASGAALDFSKDWRENT